MSTKKDVKKKKDIFCNCCESDFSVSYWDVSAPEEGIRFCPFCGNTIEDDDVMEDLNELGQSDFEDPEEDPEYD